MEGLGVISAACIVAIALVLFRSDVVDLAKQQVLAFAWLGSVALIAMLSPWSAPIWNSLRQLQYIQFANRLNVLLAVSLAVVVAALASALCRCPASHPALVLALATLLGSQVYLDFLAVKSEFVNHGNPPHDIHKNILASRLDVLLNSYTEKNAGVTYDILRPIRWNDLRPLPQQASCEGGEVRVMSWASRASGGF